jgi:hypothetical protein
MQDKRFTWTLPFCVALVLFASAPMAHGESAPPAWLQDLMARMAQVPERRETFREEKYFSALDTPLISSGQLVYHRPAYLGKITREPDAETLVVDGDRLTLTTKDQSAHSFRVDRRPEIAALVDAVRGTLAGDLPLLERHFHILAHGSPLEWTLVLVPIDPAVHKLVQDIVVGGRETSIRSFRVTQTNHDEQIMTINEQR